MDIHSYSRRRFLAVSMGITGLSTVGERSSATRRTPAGRSPKDDEVVLEQGETCVSLSPLSFQNQTIQEFYGVERPQYPGFHRPSNSSTSTNLERPQTSRLFLYRGPDGLGYVIIHGSEEGPGGAASFGIRHNPRTGKLLVQDDRSDRFRCRPNCALNWSWGGDDGGDGAVYQPLADEFEVRIDPAFNDQAVPEAPDGAEVERWQALSGDARDPDVIDLALDRPLVISSGTC